MFTSINYYLGVKTLNDAANAVNKLSFITVLDKSEFRVQITNSNRIKLSVGPASSDNDMAKGIMVYLGGQFTAQEMTEIEKLGEFANKVVTQMVISFVAEQVVKMQKQGLSATHSILGQKENKPKKKWWQL